VSENVPDLVEREGEYRSLSQSLARVRTFARRRQKSPKVIWTHMFDRAVRRTYGCGWDTVDYYRLCWPLGWYVRGGE
jgi:hypothetical protein